MEESLHGTVKGTQWREEEERMVDGKIKERESERIK